MPAGNTTTALKGKAAQRAVARRATLEMFQNRQPAEQDVELELVPGEKVSMHLVAIGARVYDKLLDACPPTKEQLAESASYNEEKFRPMLLSRVVTDPKISQEDWADLFEADNFGRGEIGDLYFSAINICSRTLGMRVVDPTEPASE